MGKAIRVLKNWPCKARRDEVILTLASAAVAVLTAAAFLSGKLQALFGGAANNLVIPGGN